MSSSVINKLLVYANQVRISGYKNFPLEYYREAVCFIYEGDLVSIGRLLGSGNVGADGSISALETFFPAYIKRYCTNSGGKTYIHPYAFMGKNLDVGYLVGPEESTKVRSLLARVDGKYRELLFQFCFMGIISTKKYLRYITDVREFIGRFVIQDAMSSRGILSAITVTPRYYYRVLAYYIENMSEGVSYGYSVYDFIYNFVASRLKSPRHFWNRNRYVDTIREISGYKISDFSIFEIPSKEFLEKYCLEVGLCLPLICRWMLQRYGAEYCSGIAREILSRSDAFLRDALLSNLDVLDTIGSEGVDCVISLA